MDCNIGDISKLFGITPQGIRYYEQQGILEPYRDAGSAYRHYRDRATSSLACSRIYRQYGFSLNDTARLVNRLSLEDIQKSVLRRQGELFKEVDRLKRILSCMERQTEGTRDVFEMGRTCILTKGPAFFWARISRLGDPEIEEDHLEKVRPWMDAIPITASSYRIPRTRLESGRVRTDIEIGMRVRAEDIGFLGVDPRDETVQAFPERECVYGIVRSIDGEPFTEEEVRHVVTYIDDNNLAVSGDAYTEIVAVERRDGKHIRYDRVFVPVSGRVPQE